MFHSNRILTSICFSNLQFSCFYKCEYFCILGLVSIVRLLLSYIIFVCFLKVLENREIHDGDSKMAALDIVM